MTNTKKIAIIGAIILIAILLVVAAMALLGGKEDYEAQIGTSTEFTPPPLSDNPPMSGSDIDAIAEEIRARNKNKDPNKDQK